MVFSFVYFPLLLRAQIPSNNECSTATRIPSIRGSCSVAAAYTNVNATPSGFGAPNNWGAVGNDVWFSFVAVAYDVNINVKGGGNAEGTLRNPLIAIYSGDCNGTINQEIGQNYPGSTQSAYYKGALTVGRTYLVRVSGQNNSTGTFQLCIDNYFPALQPGQDCSNISLLCSKDRVSPINVTGAGINNREAAGTCLDLSPGSIEANAAWYKWIAANNGTLTFSITPTSSNDDLDWVLYDLGTSGSCANVRAANAIRCAAGSGVTCSPKYFVTGMNLTSTDTQETGGCPGGQDGFVRFVDMQQGHTYALLINNFSSGNNGFTIDFTGGTGEFLGPKPTFQTQNTFCDNVFTTTYRADDIQAGYTYAWDFGDGANIRKSTSSAPVNVIYDGPGERIVTLEVTSPLGCTTYQSIFFKDLGPLPPPQIQNAPDTYCTGDTLVLQPANLIEGADAVWTLPDGSEVRETILKVPLNNTNQSGNIKLRFEVETCLSAQTATNIIVLAKPTAKFSLDPPVDQLFSAPISFNFINQTNEGVRYQWDFGDGTTSTQENPSHTYANPGRYVITLTAFNGICTDTLSTDIIKILAEGEIIVPNTFTPNNDGVNDFFNILISNLADYNIKIFNRYGTLVFTSDKILNSWDGNFEGKPMPVGVYYFIVDATDALGNKLFRKNSLTLIR